LRNTSLGAQNEATIRGKKRIDLSTDPPPDLAIEIDVTSRTHPSLYEALQVPELWQFQHGTLQINVLVNGQYQTVSESPNFPGLALQQRIPASLNESKTAGRNKVLRDFRQWVREQLG
jgi:Uma2 family endonuclease